MTALNWELAPDYALIMCDSLALSGEDHRPMFMTTKVFSLPHMGLCIAGTGVQPLAEKFWAHANSRCISRDISHLNEYAPRILRDIWQDLLADPDHADAAPGDLTGTVYCYGWGIAQNAFVGHAYRSTNNFVSESLTYGLAVKPAPNSGEVPEVKDIDDLLNLLRLQKKEDRERPRMGRIGIGGDAILTIMTHNSAGFTVIEQRPIFRFEDFDNDWQIMLAKLPSNASTLQAIATLLADP